MILQIPIGLSSDLLIEHLGRGHGYIWEVQTKKPLKIVNGCPTVSGMPDLVMLGNQALVVSGGSTIHRRRIERVMDVLLRQGGGQSG